MNKNAKEKQLLEEAYSRVLGEQSESKAPKGASFDSAKNYKPSGVDAGSDGSGGRYRRIRINKPGRSKETHGGRGVQDEEIKVGSMITTNYGEVVHIDEIDTDSDMKGRPVYMGTDKDGGEHILYPNQIHAVSPEDNEFASATQQQAGDRLSAMYRKDMLAEIDKMHKSMVGDGIDLTTGSKFSEAEVADLYKQAAERNLSKYNRINKQSNGKQQDRVDVAQAIVDEYHKTQAANKGVKLEGIVMQPMLESHTTDTSIYLTEQSASDKRNKKSETKPQSFKEKYKPKTSWQLEELRRYGL